jgi:hypothetical protein
VSEHENPKENEMSRHGYCDDCDDDLAFGRWRGRVASAIRGKRGQAFLRELRDALESMPEKVLISEQLVTADGECCAIGAVALARGCDVSDLDPEEADRVAERFGIAEVLVREIVYWNDDDYGDVTPEARWQRMRKWVENQIKQEPANV